MEPRYVIQISAGTGPSEARRFVAKLAARLEALCEAGSLVVLDVSTHGDETEPHSVSIRVAGDAEATLDAERGSHVLVHRSQARGKAARKRWYAAVTIVAIEAATFVEDEVQSCDLVVTACRAGGPGGQHVNKVSTAVRVYHRPSGLSVRVASERSQKSNLSRAILRIGSLLRTHDQNRQSAEKKSLRSSHYRLVRGESVRAYGLDASGALLVTS